MSGRGLTLLRTLLLESAGHARNLVLRFVLGLHQLDNRKTEKPLQLGSREVSHGLGEGLPAACQFHVAEHRQLLINLASSHAANIVDTRTDGGR